MSRIANEETACWASSGYSVAGCAVLESSLRACMDAPVCGDSSSHSKELSRGCGGSLEFTIISHANISAVAETQRREEEHNQLPPLANVSQDGRAPEAEVTLLYTTKA